jgi:hypothetical protein
MGYSISLSTIQAEVTLPKDNFIEDFVRPCFNFSRLVQPTLEWDKYLEIKTTGRSAGQIVFVNQTEMGSISTWFVVDNGMVTITGFGFRGKIYSRNGRSFLDNLRGMIKRHRGNLMIVGNEGSTTFIHNGVEYYGTFGSYISQFKPKPGQELKQYLSDKPIKIPEKTKEFMKREDLDLL